MCLQVPGKVIDIKENKAVIDYEIEKRIALISDIKPKKGEWVIVVGQFIVDIVPEEDAKFSLEHWKKTMLD
jgi:hydrogenase assembly chaperone HypC/HupF